MTTLVYVLIDVSIIIFSGIGILASAGILILIFYYRQQYPISTAVLLNCSTYLAILLSCLAILDMYIRNLYGDLNPTASFDNGWCYARAYALHVGLASIYYSYLLQSIYRLFRIVFFNRRRLKHFSFMFCLVLMQWSFVFVVISPALFLGQFKYAAWDYYCHILLTNLPATITATFTMYYIPVSAGAGIYAYIMYHIRHTTNATLAQTRQRTNQRDMVVLKRIVGITGVLLVLLIPAIAFWMYYIITGYLNPITDRIKWLAVAVALTILPVATVFLTPQLHHLFVLKWRRNPRVQPVVTVQRLVCSRNMIRRYATK